MIYVCAKMEASATEWLQKQKAKEAYLRCIDHNPEGHAHESARQAEPYAYLCRMENHENLG